VPFPIETIYYLQTVTDSWIENAVNGLMGKQVSYSSCTFTLPLFSTNSDLYVMMGVADYQEGWKNKGPG